MLYWAVVFLVLSLVAAIFGWGGIAAGAVVIGRVLFVGFAGLSLLAFHAANRGH